MKIYYSPEFNGNVFLGLKDKSVLFDAEVVDTMGLVGMIELRLGLHFCGKPETERETEYYKSVTAYMKDHPGNVLSKSFDLSGLEVSKTCLRWRDTLAMLGWNDKSPAVTERMRSIQGIERYFDEPGFPERISEATEAVMKHKQMFCNDIMFLPCKLELLHPAVKRIIDLMADGGMKVMELETAADTGSNLSKVRKMLLEDSKDPLTLDPDDGSFSIMNFKTELDALSYLSYQDEKAYDAWINADNKAMDNWLSMMGKPTAGSCMSGSIPQTAQLLILGIGLFYRPLNVSTLVQWLYSPVHPLDARFRYTLAETVAAEGGYDNEACRIVIEDFIGNAEDKEAAKTKASDVLPDLGIEDTGRISKKALLQFTSALKGWSSGYAKFLENEGRDALMIQQLNALTGSITSLQLLLDSLQQDFVTYDMMEGWCSSLYDAGTYLQYPAQAGSRFVIDSPTRMCGISGKTVWMNFYNSAEFHASLEFLSPIEIESLHLEDTVKRESALAEEFRQMAFTHTSESLTFVTADRRHGQPVEKHPLMIRFEKQITNLSAFISTPAFDKSLMKRCETVNNLEHPLSYSLNHPELIQWPDHISHTSMDLLIQYPLDYMMQNVADIQGSNVPAMADLKRTEGTVAHAIIQNIFTPEEGRTKKAEELKGQFRETYDTVFESQVDSHGAILNLAENKLEKKQFKADLHQCVDNLIEIIADNSLEVCWCEHRLREHVGLLSGDDDPWVNGFIDMTLMDKEGNYVVFDFKWTTSKKYYPELLRKNISSQLALYQHLLQVETGRPVTRTGYFLMPEGHLYSRDLFIGDFCDRVESEDHSDLVPKMKASYRYRREQLLSGFIENADGTMADETQYAKDAESKGLFPMHQDDTGNKQSNIFTNYPLFK